MYIIKGQDQKEYGLVDAPQVRQWLAQGRASVQSPARLEGSTDWQPLGSFPEFATAASPPPLSPTTSTLPPDSGIATIIPYRNVPALVAYYLGVFSLIPCIGFPLGIGSIVLGIFGLKRARQYPGAKGKVHAWIGIILGILVIVLHIAVWILFSVAAARRARHY
jgi:hypothetical protein